MLRFTESPLFPDEAVGGAPGFKLLPADVCTKLEDAPPAPPNGGVCRIAQISSSYTLL